MGNISEYNPRSDIEYSWAAATGLPWDPFDSCAVHTRRELACPKCGALVVARKSVHMFEQWHGFQYFWFTAYLAPGDAGWAQNGFARVCNACKFVVSRENLAVNKFARDLVRDPKNLSDVDRFGDAVYLP